ncbi:MAG: hypothetical protein ACR2QE_08585 [Acidimicrobiales bacterium]
MSQQILLLDDDTTPWHLDDDTREIGRRGVAEARAALAEAAHRHHQQPAEEHSLAA